MGVPGHSGESRKKNLSNHTPVDSWLKNTVYSFNPSFFNFGAITILQYGFLFLFNR
jgi:hypothetical protein